MLNKKSRKGEIRICRLFDLSILFTRIDKNRVLKEAALLYEACGQGEDQQQASGGLLQWTRRRSGSRWSWCGEHVEDLLNGGVAIDAAPGENGVTALMAAAAAGRKYVVRALLGQGANVELRTDT